MSEALRKEFEATAKSNSLVVERWPDDSDYIMRDTRTAWRIYQAATERAARICSDKDENVIRVNTCRGRINAASSFGAGLLEECAAAIRGQSTEQGQSNVNP